VNSRPQWWKQPRLVSVVVDNPSWIIPFAKELVLSLNEHGDNAVFVDNCRNVQKGGVAFFLGCINIATNEVLKQNYRNLIVHASDLPKGRGFSPLTWQILEGDSRIPICLLEAAELVDSGPVIFREWLEFAGHELINELRAAVGESSITLCRRYLDSDSPLMGKPQIGEASTHRRRRPADSRLDIDQTLRQQFNLLRVVDNHHYPAWFEYLGCRYKITVEKF